MAATVSIQHPSKTNKNKAPQRVSLSGGAQPSIGQARQARWDKRLKHQNIIRAALKKAPRSKLNHNAKAIALKLLNLWFTHRLSREGYIHPSKELLAKEAQCHTNTVKAVLKLLRDNDILVPLGGTKGGHGKAVRYHLKVAPLLNFIEADRVVANLVQDGFSPLAYDDDARDYFPETTGVIVPLANKLPDNLCPLPCPVEPDNFCPLSLEITNDGENPEEEITSRKKERPDQDKIYGGVRTPNGCQQ